MRRKSGLFSNFGITQPADKKKLKKCSQCRTEPATGSVQMPSGKWVRACKNCQRSMK